MAVIKEPYQIPITEHHIEEEGQAIESLRNKKIREYER